MTKVLTVQEFSLYGTSGGPRIMRSLLEDGPVPAMSVATGAKSNGITGPIPEQYLKVRPTLGRLETTRLRRSLDSLALARVRSLRVNLEEIIAAQSVKAVHSVAHGLDFVAASAAAKSCSLPLFLTVHDHPAYTFAGWPTRSLALRLLRGPWRDAAHRYVISRELGEDLCQRYGGRPYTIVTDGVAAVSQPRARPSRRKNVYFMGAFHVSYRQNLRAILKGLALYRDRTSAEVSLLLRGGGPSLSTTDAAGVPVTVLPWGSQEDVEADLERADLLYMPLPFGSAHEYLVRYSLSTKLVTFVASGLPILFHGPEDSAAGHLLSTNGAAVCINSLDPQAIASSLHRADNLAQTVSAAAANLAERDFRIEDQRDRFWRPLQDLVVGAR